MEVMNLSRKFDLILNVPGNDKPFKLNLSVSGKQLLLMCYAMENGVQFGGLSPDSAADWQSAEAAAEIRALIPELLKRGDPQLVSFYEKLKQL